MNCYYSQLNQEALLHIEGPDTLTFLQGQTTCDTRSIDASSSALGVYCTPQGRVVCDFLLLQLAQDHFALRMRRDIRESSAAVFSKYIVFSKAALDEQRDDWLVVGVWGEDARTVIHKTFGAAPQASMECTGADDYVIVQTDETGERFECYLSSDADSLSRLSASATRADEAQWHQLQITAGIARIEAATVEAFVPQVLNYDVTGHISFTKGCYTGQEVVARLHYRGKSKRRTYLATIGAAAATGDSLFAPDSEQSVGDVVNAVDATSNDGDGTRTLALVAATNSAAQSQLHLKSPSGPLLVIHELPYEIDE